MVGFTYLTIVLWATRYQHPEKLDGVMIMLTSFLTLTSLFLLREASLSGIKLKIIDNELLIRPSFGLWTQRTRLDDVTGYTRSQEYSKTSAGQSIYIYVRQRTRVEVSDAYYKNIDHIVAGLSGKVKKLGKENSSIFKHLLNTFGVPIEFRGSKMHANKMCNPWR